MLCKSRPGLANYGVRRGCPFPRGASREHSSAPRVNFRMTISKIMGASLSRRITSSLAAVGLTLSTVLVCGAGIAQADTIITLTTTGATLYWDENDQEFTLRDTQADGDTAYAYLWNAVTGQVNEFHTTGGNGTEVQFSPSGVYDLGGYIQYEVARVNSSFKIVNQSGSVTEPW